MDSNKDLKIASLEAMLTKACIELAKNDLLNDPFMINFLSEQKTKSISELSKKSMSTKTTRRDLRRVRDGEG